MNAPRENPTKRQPSPRLTFTDVAGWSLIAVGAAALVASIHFSSSILAFIGLGLLFWGIILKLITTEEYIKRPLLDTASLSALTALDEILTALNYNGKAVYLPPKYLTDSKANRVYIPKQADTQLPRPEQLRQEDQTFLTNPEGLSLTPPGNELTKLFENTLRTNFTKADLPYLEQTLPKLLIQDLEIAQDVKIESKAQAIHIRIVSTLYKEVTREARKLSDTTRSLGVPLISALACALAKATAHPVMITRQQTSQDGKRIDIEYRLLEQP